MGIGFNSEGSLDSELIIYKNLNIKIPKKVIDAIKSEIACNALTPSTLKKPSTIPSTRNLKTPVNH